MYNPTAMRSASWAHFRSGTNTKTKDTDFRVPKYYYIPLQNTQTNNTPQKSKTTSSGSGPQTEIYINPQTSL